MTAADPKRLANAAARAALAGATLHALQNDDGSPLYVVTWRALTRSFDDLAAVEGWLTRFEGGKP